MKHKYSTSLALASAVFFFFLTVVAGIVVHTVRPNIQDREGEGLNLPVCLRPA